MTFTWDGTLDTDVEKIRSLIGDTDSTDALMTDEEINYHLSRQSDSDLVLAAALCCDAIAAKFARKASFSNGALSVGAERFKFYSELAKTLRNQAAEEGNHTAGIYIGGRRHSERDVLEGNSDLVQPSFSVGMDDHPGASDASVLTDPE